MFVFGHSWLLFLAKKPFLAKLRIFLDLAQKMLLIQQTITAMKRLSQEQSKNLVFFKFFVLILISILLWKAGEGFWKANEEISLQKSLIEKMSERVQELSLFLPFGNFLAYFRYANRIDTRTKVAFSAR